MAWLYRRCMTKTFFFYSSSLFVTLIRNQAFQSWPWTHHTKVLTSGVFKLNRNDNNGISYIFIGFIRLLYTSTCLHLSRIPITKVFENRFMNNIFVLFLISFVYTLMEVIFFSFLNDSTCVHAIVLNPFERPCTNHSHFIICIYSAAYFIIKSNKNNMRKIKKYRKRIEMGEKKDWMRIL